MSSLLWQRLRFWQVDGYKFRRQHFWAFTLSDFVCRQKRLIIELDGGQHAQETNYDAARDAWLRHQGFIILRFWNNDVLKNIDGVMTKICTKLQGTPTSILPRKGEGRRRKAATVHDELALEQN